MDKTYSGDVVLLTTTGRMVARVHAHFVAHESAGGLAGWDGEIWPATRGPLRLQASDYKVQFPNGTVSELTVERGFFQAPCS